MPGFLWNSLFQATEEGSYLFGKQTIHKKKENKEISKIFLLIPIQLFQSS